MPWWRESAENEVLERLRRIERKLNTLTVMEVAVAKEIDDLRAEVEENGSVVASAVTLLSGLKAALDAAIASNDMGAVRNLRDQLDANNQQLADAVAANTPAAPAPTPTPDP